MWKPRREGRLPVIYTAFPGSQLVVRHGLLLWPTGAYSWKVAHQRGTCCDNGRQRRNNEKVTPFHWLYFYMLSLGLLGEIKLLLRLVWFHFLTDYWVVYNFIHMFLYTAVLCYVFLEERGAGAEQVVWLFFSPAYGCDGAQDKSPLLSWCRWAIIQALDSPTSRKDPRC